MIFDRDVDNIDYQEIILSDDDMDNLDDFCVVHEFDKGITKNPLNLMVRKETKKEKLNED